MGHCRMIYCWCCTVCCNALESGVQTGDIRFVSAKHIWRAVGGGGGSVEETGAHGKIAI